MDTSTQHWHFHLRLHCNFCFLGRFPCEHEEPPLPLGVCTWHQELSRPFMVGVSAIHRWSFTCMRAASHLGQKKGELAFTYVIVSKHTVWMRHLYAPPPTPPPPPSHPWPPIRMVHWGCVVTATIHSHHYTWIIDLPERPRTSIWLRLFVHSVSVSPFFFFLILFVSINSKPTTLFIPMLSRNALELLTFTLHVYSFVSMIVFWKDKSVVSEIFERTVAGVSTQCVMRRSRNSHSILSRKTSFWLREKYIPTLGEWQGRFWHKVKWTKFCL